MLTSDIDPFDEPHQRKVSTLEDIHQKYIDGGYIYARYDKASIEQKPILVLALFLLIAKGLI